MAVPRFYDFCLPILAELAANRAGVKLNDLYANVPRRVALGPDELAETIPSGQSTVLNRIGWALSHMKKAGWVSNPSRGLWVIDEAGLARLGVGAPVQLRELKWADTDDLPVVDKGKEANELTPLERINQAKQELLSAVVSTIRDRLASVPPKRFEQIVLELLQKMGYTGDLGHVVHAGAAGDGGIDGIIYLDRLGLERVYVQAKRWQHSVGSSVVREFAGAMDGEGATKGVILTTSTFTPEAEKYLTKSHKAIRLVGGSELGRLMVEFGVGVVPELEVKIPKVDEDYFEPA